MLEQTSQATARLMNFGKIILILAVLVISITSRADSFNQMIRSLGSFQLDSSDDRVEITKTNNQVVFKVTLEHGRSSVLSDNDLKNGWFVFLENSLRVWVFDGQDLWVFQQTEKSSGLYSDEEHFVNCPKQVQDALLSKVRERYFNKN
ncbi:MAG TPA: hypothetical protein VE344_00865 [Methylomirabilota bacterium]|nr:hypothetical protein [Methylomirabilota bacterium]